MTKNQKVPLDPVRKWTFITLGACVLLMIFYLTRGFEVRLRRLYREFVTLSLDLK